jgi:hypothetical protein
MKPISGKWGVIYVMIGITLLSHAEVRGENWKFLRVSKGGDHCYYDADSITRPSKNNVRGLVKIVYSEKSINREMERPGSSYKDLSHTIILWEMNCIEKKATFLETTTYSKNEKILKSIKAKTITWASIVPETMGEDLYKALCR